MRGAPWIRQAIEDFKGANGTPWISTGLDVFNLNLPPDEKATALGTSPSGAFHRRVAAARARQRDCTCQLVRVTDDTRPDPRIVVSDGSVHIGVLVSRAAMRDLALREGALVFSRNVGAFLAVRAGYFALCQRTGVLVLVLTRFAFIGFSKHTGPAPDLCDVMQTPVAAEEAARIKRELAACMRSFSRWEHEAETSFAEMLARGEIDFSECSDSDSGPDTESAGTEAPSTPRR